MWDEFVRTVTSTVVYDFTISREHLYDVVVVQSYDVSLTSDLNWLRLLPV